MSRNSMLALVDEYLAHRHAMGFTLTADRVHLHGFARFADADKHRGSLTVDLVQRWVTCSPKVTPVTWARRLAPIRGFARYRQAFDPATEVPPGDLFGPLHNSRCPYIYSNGEIKTLLAEAAELAPTDGLRPVTMRTIFGLLASTGLRISEALRLTGSDVDFSSGVLTIRQTKFAKTRYVPMHATTTAALETYVNARSAHVMPSRSTTFFVTDAGRPLRYDHVRYSFLVIRRRLGWQAGQHRPAPRIHDLRHTFVCHRLLAWHQEGVDVDHAIAILSTYLGHARVSDTYWYVTGIPELMAIVGSRFESYTGGAEEALK